MMPTMSTPPRARNAEATRSAILAAAREHFGDLGYEKTTLRAIAADAGIDPALVIRYFGSKEALFASVADFDLRMPDLSAVPRSRLGRAIATHLVDRWEGDVDLKILLRASVTNPLAADRCKDIFATQVMKLVLKFDSDRKSAATRAALISSQALGMALTRYVLCLPPMAGLDKDALIDWLAPTFQRYLTA